MQFNCKMGYSGNEQDYQLIKTSLSKLKKCNNQTEVLRYLTNVLPNPTDVVTLDNAQDTVKSVKAQLANKNLIPYPYAETRSNINGVSVTYGNDGSVIFNGTAASNIYFKVFERLKIPAGQYYLSGTPAEGGVGVAFLYFFETDNQNTAYNAYTTNGVACSLSGTEYSGRIYIAKGQTVENLVFKPQLELGTTATAYTPYVPDLTAVKVNTYGKNFIDIDSIANDIVKKNPTSCEITDFDGKRCLKLGTTSTIKYTIQTLIPLYGLQLKVYSTGYSAGFMGYTKNDTGTSVFYINVSDENEWVNIKRYYPAVSQYYTEIRFYKTDATKPIYIDLDSVMLEASHTATEYEPYQGQTYTPTATGEVTGIEVLSPTTNIINDKGLLFTKVTGDDFNYIN